MPTMDAWSLEFTSDDYPAWIESFKVSERGPFSLVVWHCNDGTELPPEPGACARHGGGKQYAKWNEKASILRESGYYLANILASIDAQQLVAASEPRKELKHILIERYLINTDNGWIFRGARYHRGILQSEDEYIAARRILIGLSEEQNTSHDYLLLHTTAKLLPHDNELESVARIRELASAILEYDIGFEMLRNKIHSQPDAEDANRVRSHVTLNMIEEPADYVLLASLIDDVYSPGQLDPVLDTLISSLPRKEIAARFRKDQAALKDQDARTRLHVAAGLLALLRAEHPFLNNPAQWMDAIEARTALEQEAFTAGAAVLQNINNQSRAQRITLLTDIFKALYGSGELSPRQWQSLKETLDHLSVNELSLQEYRQHLRYLSRVRSWVNRNYQYLFSASVDEISVLESRARNFIPDQLRGSLLLHSSAILDSLTIEADRVAGVGHQVMGIPVGSGVRMLNPGLVRGVLHATAPRSDKKYHPDDIYMMPETSAHLPPVAGILTLGEGNSLSHVQILAQNLGIPNILIANQVHDFLREYNDKRVVIAATPGGRVIISPDGANWNHIFESSTPASADLLDANLQKLDLNNRDLTDLDTLRSGDAGRIVGPKAANLGELKHHFPDHVPSGVVIPFGVFYDLLQQPRKGSNKTLFAWMQSEYQRIAMLPEAEKIHARNRLLSLVHDAILKSDPGKDFWKLLRKELEEQIGDIEEITLFVRSDTNMEDLPGFTGAGLNLTVANVKGFESLKHAIKRVWASPFTERAFAWRQTRMKNPEHVYISILLMPSISVDKSGVMVTTDITNNQTGWITVATNEGIGGAVQGQAAEELRINTRNGQSQLLAPSSNPTRRILNSEGGLDAVAASGESHVLSRSDIQQLIWLSKKIQARLPMKNEQDEHTPVDVEFGFNNGKLVLFQARPYLESKAAQQHHYLNRLDASIDDTTMQVIRLDEDPRSSGQ
jgi:hypothetical protein